jgi:peptidyl-prolyl cis-trans isomerase SurA
MLRGEAERSSAQAPRSGASLLTLCLVAVLVAGCGLVRWVGLVDDDQGAGPTPSTAASPQAGAPTPQPTRPQRGATPEARTKEPAPPAPAPRPPEQVKTTSILVDEDGVVDRVVAVVNNDVITLNELRETVLYYRVETKQTGGDDEEVARELLGRLIEARLQLQEAAREKIGVEEVELAEELSARMRKANTPSEQDFEALIRRQGLTLDVVKKKLREQLLIAKIIRRKVAFRVSVTEEEVDRDLAENRDKLETGLTYHARHILFPVGGDRSEAAWAEALARAEDAAASLKAGADFADLARRLSGDATAAEGGDLGTLRRGELAAEIEATILGLEAGQVSAPFRTDLGYHVFKLEAKDTLEGDSLGRVRQQIRDILFREKYKARLDAWLAEIKQRAIIEIRI